MTHQAQPHKDCKATKQDLRESGCNALDYCPMCRDDDPNNSVLCRVGNEPNEATSQGMSDR